MAICSYSSNHARQRVPATTEIDGGLVGAMQVCEACANLYHRMSADRRDLTAGRAVFETAMSAYYQGTLSGAR
jgi:hypothetical protein